MSRHSELFKRRQNRVRAKIRKALSGHYRLCVFRSNKHIYAQIIDDEAGKTLVAFSTTDKGMRTKLKNTSDVQAAEEIGKNLAKNALKKGIKEVVFDRGGYLYHGRVRAVAMGARAEGLVF